MFLVFGTLVLMPLIFLTRHDLSRSGDDGVTRVPVKSEPVSVAASTPIASGESEALGPVGVVSSLPSADTASTQTGNVLWPVPFVSQAPSGQWSDIVFQNACEEASMLMAVSWMRGEIRIERHQAEESIRKISELTQTRFGEGTHDTSVEDTSRIFEELYGPLSLEVLPAVSLEIIRNRVLEGDIVIVPADGRKLRNPHFRSPGPEFHMLVIRGYDSDRKEFITNDPGTWFGEGYRYDEDRLYAAIRDYETGYHEKLTASSRKNVLVATKNP